MKLANLDGRAVLMTGPEMGIDVATASDGAFGPDLAAVYDDWANFRAWASNALAGESIEVRRNLLGPPSPAPRQILAIGLNYREHAAESGLAVPEGLPPVFTKFLSSLTGPDTVVELPIGGNVDWEVELVVVMGATARNVAESNGWDYVAGLTVGQDLSERVGQLAGPAAQFSLAKSLPGFSPTGPWLVTPDEVHNPDDLALGCSLDGEAVQRGRSADLVVSVPDLIAELSRRLTLYPGDLIFTGTPAGVGLGRTPPRYIVPGQRLESWVEGIGVMTQSFH